jgi:hypothetical protein
MFGNLIALKDRQMHTINCLKSVLVIAVAIAATFFSASVVEAQVPGVKRTGRTPEQRTARYFESIRKSPPQMLAFLRKMPKGADLHTHLSGAVYAESYIQWAAENGLCLNRMTMSLTQPPCSQASGQVSMSTALTDRLLYRQLIDSWSMRNWQYSGTNGHDQFFDSFGKFGGATSGQRGRMLAEVASRAARGRVSYLELMTTPDGGISSQLGSTVGWDGNFEGTLNKLKAGGIGESTTAGVKILQEAEDEKNKLLKCGTAQEDPGCSVTIRYIAQVSRGSAPGQVFAQMVMGLALANEPNSRVVGLNLVEPEDWLLPMQNFRLHMDMLNFLKPKYPDAHISLHAGELAPGLVPPEGLTFHIRESIMKGRAERIGHGVSIMHEDDPYELLKEMARRRVMVEICLTSNDLILGIRKEQHPLSVYLQHGVPVSLATDDEGVSRSDITREYLKAAEEHDVGFVELKTMARNSLEFAFLSGKSLWADAKKFIPVTECALDIRKSSEPSGACNRYLTASEKARLQWKLEQDLKSFEAQY